MSWLPSRVAYVVLLALAVAACAHRGTTARNDADTLAAQDAFTRANTVRADDIQRQPGESIEQILAGRVAGVDVSRTPDGGISVRIRGAASFTGSTQPLYVIDGMPIEPGPNGSLTGINPHDIESIKVLKNPADVGLYGIRGANGVIVIKTKRPGT